MFGNRFELGFSGDVVASSIWQYACTVGTLSALMWLTRDDPLPWDDAETAQRAAAAIAAAAAAGRMLVVGEDPLRKGGPVQCFSSRLSHWSPRLWKFTFRVDRIEYLTGAMGWKIESRFSRRASHKSTIRPKVENPTWKSKVGVLPWVSVVFNLGNRIAPSSPIEDCVSA